MDLDGTLVKSDMIYETVNQLICSKPWRVFEIFWNLVKGKTAFKKFLAEKAEIDVTSLPYNPHLMSWLVEQKKRGRYIVLATATHRILADKIAEYTKLFDEVLASAAGVNLKSGQKRDALIRKFGKHGFDYVGNEQADVPVWEAANVVHIVSSNKTFIRRVELLTQKTANTFPSVEVGVLSCLFKALRVHQWMKNLLVFIPLVLAYPLIPDGSAEGTALLAFILFGITASSVYILNDLSDLSNDRLHRSKKNRMFASGNLSIGLGWVLWPALLILSFAVSSFFMNMKFIYVMLGYLLLTVMYSFRLKQIAMLDVLTLAMLYTARIVAGAVALNLPISFWLLGFSIFIFLSLAFMKRFSELQIARANLLNESIRGRGYVHQDLEIVSSMGVTSGYISVLVLGLYIYNPIASEYYMTPELIWMVCPILIYWISRVWLITHRGGMHDDPVFFAIKDRRSWMVGALIFSVFLLAKNIRI